ncbi:MAG: DUF4167 domain-containing protein [Alphaproteobacteria bacterium]
MRHGLSNRRQQRNNNRGGSNNQNRSSSAGGNRPPNQRTQVYDSNGPDVRIRGTAHQVTEKYQLLARDAASAGDRVLSESYLQHAEHYQRIINSWEAENPTPRPAIRPDETVVDGNAVAVTQTGDQAVREDHLGLPASILGVVPKVSDDNAEIERTGFSRQATTEDA